MWAIKKTKLYYCNPKKNYECNKSHCHINGGPCHLTTKRKFRQSNIIECLKQKIILLKET